MAEQDAEHAVGALHGVGEASAADGSVGTAALVLDTDDGQAVAAASDEGVAVHEDAPSELLLLVADEEADERIAPLGRDVAGIGVVVVVAQHAEHAVAGAEAGEGLPEVEQFAEVERDEVAGEDDEVGLEGVNRVGNLLQASGVTLPSVGVEVADLHDAVAVERRWQSAAAQLDLLDLEAEAPDPVPVGIESPPQNHEGEPGHEERTPREGMVEQAGDEPAHGVEDLGDEEQDERKRQ